jgi:hypothetical protein
MIRVDEPWAWTKRPVPFADSGGGRGRRPGDLVPDREAVGHHLSVVGRRQQVPTGPKVRRDAAERGQEPLRVPDLAAPGGCRSRNLSSRKQRPASLRRPEPLCAADADYPPDTGPRSAELSAVAEDAVRVTRQFLPGGRAGRSALPRHGPRWSTRTAPARARPPC